MVLSSDIAADILSYDFNMRKHRSNKWNMERVDKDKIEGKSLT